LEIGAMNEAMLALVIRGVGMVMMILVGLFQVHVGYKSYRARSQLGADKSNLRFGKFTVSSNSVGAFVMGSAFVWGLAASWAVPSYSKESDAVKVTALPMPAEFQTAVLTTSPTSNARKTLRDPSELQALFTRTAADAQASTPGWVTLNSVPASFDLNSVKAVKAGPNSYVITSDVSAGDQSATITYAPFMVNDKIRFVPARVSGRDDNK
jgi:hypothetical protein